VKELCQKERLNTGSYSGVLEKLASGAKPPSPYGLALLIGMVQMQHEMLSQRQTPLDTYQVRHQPLVKLCILHICHLLHVYFCSANYPAMLVAYFLRGS
jgi:hypothetical protein